MDSNWLQWRHYETLWEEFEEKGWELGALKYVNLPHILAEFGPYRVVLRYRDPATNESLFEMREMHEGEERRTVLVWGVPTTAEAEDLLQRYGVGPDEVSNRPSVRFAVDSRAAPEGFWDELVPPIVHLRESWQAAPVTNGEGSVKH